MQPHAVSPGCLTGITTHFSPDKSLQKGYIVFLLVMSAIVKGGYNAAQCTLLNKDGQPLESDDLKRYMCVRCKYILRLPYQMVCGDRICRDCFPTSSFECWECGDFIDPSKPQQFFTDKSCQNDIKSFTIVCKCGYKGNLDEWELHSEGCSEIMGEAAATVGEATPEMARRMELELRKLAAEVTEAKRQSSKALRKTESLEKDVKQVKALVEELRREPPRAAEGEEAKFGASGDVDARPQVRRLNEKYSQLNEIVTQLVSDVEQHKGTLAQINTTVDHFSQVLPRCESLIDEMNLKIEILEVKSTSGVYVWKVNELNRRYREARVGKTVSLYSPPFYTSPHGYRLCLRAYLYGDGVGKGTHISLFVVLMKSEYDDILSWPFKHRVTLSIINQDNPLSADAALMHKFLPNPDSTSFQKPRDTFNIASGFPQFASQNFLSDPSFVKNDTIYFMVRLDPPDIPTGPDSVSL